MENTLELAWELSVLARAVAYQNLSGASSHVGLSQPQLSRIVARLESGLGLTLLDRSVRRKSSWTPVALKLAETFQRSARGLSSQIQALSGRPEPTELHVGCLEGLMSLALKILQYLFKNTSIHILELNVYDLDFLEELFFKGELDLVFSSNEPGRRKYRYSLTLGYQSLDTVSSPGDTEVMSSFEYGSTAPKKNRGPAHPVLISNSLAVRKNWIENFGGTGVIPSEVRRTRGKGRNEQPVYLVGNDALSDRLWSKISEFKG